VSIREAYSRRGLLIRLIFLRETEKVAGGEDVDIKSESLSKAAH